MWSRHVAGMRSRNTAGIERRGRAAAPLPSRTPRARRIRPDIRNAGTSAMQVSSRAVPSSTPGAPMLFLHHRPRRAVRCKLSGPLTTHRDARGVRASSLACTVTTVLLLVAAGGVCQHRFHSRRGRLHAHVHVEEGVDQRALPAGHEGHLAAEQPGPAGQQDPPPRPTPAAGSGQPPVSDG